MHTTRTATPPIPDYDVFVEGELVMLKSGGPVMTVIGYCEDCDEIECAYGDSDGDLSFAELPSAAIVRVQ